MDLANIGVSFLVGTVGAGIASAVIKKYYDTRASVWSSQRRWKEQAVAELLGPIYAQLRRTEAAFRRWNKKDLYLEASVIHEGNAAIRDLLLAKPHLIPPELRPGATQLVVHFDVWLEKFDRLRRDPSPTEQSDFVFVGPDGYPFPRDADKAFSEIFERYWHDLYTDQKPRLTADQARQ